jgi:CRISPR-associated protein Csm4
MVTFKVYKLRFTSPLHLGDERADYDKTLSIYHSDSMYAAITAVLANIGYDIPETGDFGFTISSLFPYYQKSKDDEPVYFLPKIKKQDNFSPEIRKKVKNIKWLDIDSFNKYINGEQIFGKVSEDFKGEYLTSRDIDKEFIKKSVNPRVTVSRTGQEDARPFYMDRLYFKYQSGMYFIVEGENTEVMGKALDILKDEGIGTDRTVGNGFFEWEKSEIQLDLPESEYATNLSLFLPKSKEELKKMIPEADKNIAYSFQKRGGWITEQGLNTFRKNSIYMFDEGSVFKTDDIDNYQVKGRIVDLKPNLDYEHLNKKAHPVWRNGKAIFIPVKI